MAQENNRKPDYTDLDWSGLIADRTEKWKVMLKTVGERGWQTFSLREDKGFTSKLILLPVHKEQKRGLLIVCAGGGFMFKSSNEALPVAEFFHAQGINAAILDYHVDPVSPMGENENIRLSAGADGLAAVRFSRAHSDMLGILPDKIAIGGFSAGGIVSAIAATMFDQEDKNTEKSCPGVSSRPDAALILYGAFAQTGMGGSVGQHDPKVQARKCKSDPIRNIRSDCPPMFVFQTHKDDPRYALLFCYELACHGVPYEIHTFEEGPHGGGLYDGKTEDSPLFEHTAQWAMLASSWLKEKGF